MCILAYLYHKVCKSRVEWVSPPQCLVPCGSKCVVQGPQPTIFTCFTYWAAQKDKPKNPNTKSQKKVTPISKKSKKKSKKSFCYKNVDKMFHQPQKAPFSL